MNNRPQLLVRVDTDSGIYGWGESGLTSREDAVAAAIKHYACWLVDRDPMNIAALWQEMYRSQYFEGGRVLTAAISALDIALHDIKGKKLGVPVWQLLGGKQREYIDTFATVRSQELTDIIQITKDFLNAGWRCIRLPRKEASPAVNGGFSTFEPWDSISVTADWISKVRAEVGHGPVLGLDYHHRLSVAEAASFCQRLAPGTLDWIEEPIRDEAPAAYEALRRMTQIPFAIGEEFSSKWQFLPYIERDITQYARVDICNVGGFTEALKVAGWCEAHYVDLMPHNPLGPICTTATLHMSAAISNLAWVECWEMLNERKDPFEDSLFINCPKLIGHRYRVPDQPGLGIDINESRIHEFIRDDIFEFPHLRRRDGSHTNW